MDDPAGEDDYSDDDLDALPDHALHQLQQNAIQSTQQPSLSAHVQLPSIKQPIASHLGRFNIQGSASHAAHQPPFQAPSSDYGDFDEDMLDGEIFDAAEEPTLAAKYKISALGKEPAEYSQREQWRLQRYGMQTNFLKPTDLQHRGSQQGAVGVPTYNNDNVSSHSVTARGREAEVRVNKNHTQPPLQESADLNALQAQVQKVGLPKLELKELLAYTSV